MRKFSCFALASTSLAVVVYLCSCMSGGAIDPTDPILPAQEPKEEAVVDPQTREITITKDDVTVIVQHWSRTRLNRKYTTVDMRSPFFYLEIWDQGFQSEVFHVTIKNDTPRKIVINLRETVIEDEREYVYKPQVLEDFKYKFVTKKMMDMKTKNGMQEARRIMLDEILGPKREVPAGGQVEGFLPFPATSSIVTKLWLKLVLEREPEVATGNYERVEFRFDYTQDPALRKKQPEIKRT